MSRAEEFLKKYNIPNIKWTSYINSQGEVKEGMDFPYSVAEVMDYYLKNQVNAISDEIIDKYSRRDWHMWFAFGWEVQKIRINAIKWHKNKLLKQYNNSSVKRKRISNSESE